MRTESYRTRTAPDPYDVLWYACRLAITPMSKVRRQATNARLLRLIDGKTARERER